MGLSLRRLADMLPRRCAAPLCRAALRGLHQEDPRLGDKRDGMRRAGRTRSVLRRAKGTAGRHGHGAGMARAWRSSAAERGTEDAVRGKVHRDCLDGPLALALALVLALALARHTGGTPTGGLT